MDEKTKKQLELHVAGATVRHNSPFEILEHYDNGHKLELEFIKKWVHPFYMFSINQPDEYIKNFNPVRAELNSEIAKKLLGDFNWRTRIVGAHFAMINEYRELETIIGIHLLKSQVCYAGTGYCLALASFNSENGIDFLKRYLDYYLTRKDLFYDQRDAMAALNWTDRINGTSEMDKFLPKFTEWSNGQDKLEIEIARFDNQMESINKIKTA